MMEWASAIEVARAIRVELQPACGRIEIGGSLRRLRPEINDIEIIAKPRVDPFNELDLLLIGLIAKKRLAPGPGSSDGKKPPYGPRYKRLAEPLSGMQVDVFSVLPPAEWGIIYAVRTGSAHFSHWLATRAIERGMRIRDGQLYTYDKTMQPWREFTIPCPEEENFFQALGMPWIPPQNREQPPAPNLGLGPFAFGDPSASSAALSRDKLPISTASTAAQTGGMNE